MISASSLVGFVHIIHHNVLRFFLGKVTVHLKIKEILMVSLKHLYLFQSAILQNILNSLNLIHGSNVEGETPLYFHYHLLLPPVIKGNYLHIALFRKKFRMLNGNCYLWLHWTYAIISEFCCKWYRKRIAEWILFMISLLDFTRKHLQSRETKCEYFENVNRYSSE